jgi:hypothetical protein
MTATVQYKIIDLNPDPHPWMQQVQETLKEQAQEGWELVAALQREHEAQQVGSTTVHVPGLVSTVLIFKRAC